MSIVVEGGSWVVPGDRLAEAGSALVGVGVYADERTGDIRASLLGRVLIEDLSSTNKKQPSSTARVNVVVREEDFKTSSSVLARDYVPRVGDIVLARILRTNYNQAYVDILALGDQPLPVPIKAVIRREDIRETEVDKVVVQDFFKPFDVVRAVVISLGDSKYYFLSTANKSTSTVESTVLGVVVPQPRANEI